jgi:uncharacterized delta-60 repeat protein
MMNRILLHLTFLLLTLLFLADGVLAQAGSNDPSFNTADVGFGIGDGPDFAIRGVALQPDGKSIIVGSFGTYNGISRTRVARLNTDGSLDPTFNPGTGANSTTETVAVQADGKILIGGGFTSYNGTARNRIARLNADGSLDPTFDPGTGVENTVRTIVVQPDGKIIIGGSFTTYNGSARGFVARLNADGSLDATFNSSVGAGFTVRCAQLQSDGKLIIGGDFTTYNGTTVNRLARLNTNGSLDATFNVGTGANNNIYDLFLQPDGKVVAVGDFNNFGGTSINRIARVNTDGSFDATFNPGTGVNGLVNKTCLQADGRIVIVGSFTTVNGSAKNRIARLNADGSLDGTFNSGTGLDNTALSCLVQTDGRILIAGTFTAYNGVGRIYLARLNTDGSLHSAFNVSTGANGSARVIVQQPDGKILVGGDFTWINGVSRNRIARLNADGSLDATFDPGTGANNIITAVLLQSDGKVVVTGFFTSFNGTTLTRIARLNADGSLDATFNPGTGASGTITTAQLQSDGKIVIGGNFTSYNGTARNRIARINSDGTLDATFAPGSGANQTINYLCLQSDGKVIIGGVFTTYNGTGRVRLARLNTNGTLDGTFGVGTGALGNVDAIAVQSDGKILIGGSFTSYNGTSRNRIARVNANGSLDGTFAVGTGASSGVSGIALQTDGKIILGGSFTTYNGTGRNYLARVNTDGSLDTSFDPAAGPNGSLACVTIQADGKILIGGSMTAYGASGRNRMARVFAETVITWTGTTSTAWNLGTNWSTGTVPLATDNITIPNVANDPIISTGVTINDVIMESGATLAVASGGSITLNGTLANAGAVIIQSGGSFLQGASSSITGAGTFTAQRQGTADATRFNYWSSPVVGGTLPGSSGYRYDSSLGTNSNTDDAPSDAGWQTFSGAMAEGRGYASKGGGLASFTGAPRNGDINVPVTFYGNAMSATTPGTDFVLLGNPYPSGLTVNTFLTNNAARLSGQVWAWDDDGSGGTGYLTADYASRTTAGSISGGNGNSIGAQLASSQGFMAKVISTGTVQFNNGQRSATNGAFLRLAEDDAKRIWVSLDNGSHFNEVNVVFMDDATDAYDMGMDGLKLRGSADIALAVRPDYASETHEELCIAALPPLYEGAIVELTAFVAEAGPYMVRNRETENMEGVRVWLGDRTFGIETEITDAGITAVHLAEGETVGRLYLRFALNATDVESPQEQEECLTAWMHNGMLTIMTDNKSAGQHVTLHDLYGRTVWQSARIGERFHADLSGLSPGIYVVRMEGRGNCAVKVAR